jgi:hypothetical protein
MDATQQPEITGVFQFVADDLCAFAAAERMVVLRRVVNFT